MTAQMIDASGPEYSRGGGIAERAMHTFLSRLPDDYYVIREGKLTPSRERQAQGSEGVQPDFIVVGPELGIMILEVKDWNIHANTFEFVRFDKVLRTSRRPPHNSELMTNPWHQAQGYNHAMRELLRKSGKGQVPWVSHFVVFSRMPHADFNNTISYSDVANPQNTQVLDPHKHTLFKDDLDKYYNRPLELLQTALASSYPYKYMPSSYTVEQVLQVVRLLIPHEILVGGLASHAAEEKRLALLDRKQQQWALSDQLDDKQYLADVAGSGKTNVLLSRAMHIARKRLEQGGSCNILVTTYSKPLGLELERIFSTKLGEDDIDYAELRQAIKIQDIRSLMEEIIRVGRKIGIDFTRDYNDLKQNAPDVYYSEYLPQICKELIDAERERFQYYDYAFIDEIQDFHNDFMDIVRGVLKNPGNILAVGDIGQKLLPHLLDWGRYDIIRNRVELKGTFRMYRNPQPIARMAWSFLTSDKDMCQKLEAEGYQLNIKQGSPLTYEPVFVQCTNEDELLQEICRNIQDNLYETQYDRILCIGLNNHLLLQLYKELRAASLPVRLATEESKAGKYIILADYLDAKGLERELVYIVDADNLNQNIPRFTTLEEANNYTQHERIKLFVALTRTTREVRLYYIDRTHPFIRELLAYRQQK